MEIRLKDRWIENNHKLFYINEFYHNSDENTAVIGHNGTGKTTFLKFLYNNYRDTGIFIHDVPYIFNDTVYKNIILEKGKINEITDYFIEVFDFNKYLNTNGKKLSRGEKKILGILRGFAHFSGDKILFLDEPDSNLNNIYKNKLIEGFKKFNIKNVIFTTHDPIFYMKITQNVYKIEGKKFYKSYENIFEGSFFSDGYFKKNDLKIYTNIKKDIKGIVMILPQEIVITKDEIQSSMQNHFKGVIKEIIKSDGFYILKVLANEPFYVKITEKAMNEMKWKIDDKCLIYFKSSSCKVVFYETD